MQDDIASLMESDVAEKTSSSLVIGDVQLKQAANLAAMIKTETEHVKVLEENLKECKKNLMKLTDEDLPQLLTELGMSSFKMADGSSVEIKKTYGASIPVANRAQAYQWLRDNGFGDGDIWSEQELGRTKHHFMIHPVSKNIIKIPGPPHGVWFT